jgi:hypothetical protein
MQAAGQGAAPAHSLSGLQARLADISARKGALEDALEAQGRAPGQGEAPGSPADKLQARMLGHLCTVAAAVRMLRLQPGPAWARRLARSLARCRRHWTVPALLLLLMRLAWASTCRAFQTRGAPCTSSVCCFNMAHNIPSHKSPCAKQFGIARLTTYVRAYSLCL